MMFLKDGILHTAILEYIFSEKFSILRKPRTVLSEAESCLSH